MDSGTDGQHNIMDGWMDGWGMERRMYGWVDGWMGDGKKDVWMG